MSDVERFRQQAKDCRKRSAKTADEGERALLIALAEALEEAADQDREAPERPAHPDEHTTPQTHYSTLFGCISDQS